MNSPVRASYRKVCRHTLDGGVCCEAEGSLGHADREVGVALAGVRLELLLRRGSKGDRLGAVHLTCNGRDLLLNSSCVCVWVCACEHWQTGSLFGCRARADAPSPASYVNGGVHVVQRWRLAGAPSRVGLVACLHDSTAQSLGTSAAALPVLGAHGTHSAGLEGALADLEGVCE